MIDFTINDFTINKEGDGFTVVFPNGTSRQATLIETALCQRIDVLSRRLADAEAREFLRTNVTLPEQKGEGE